jgi:hypothetical protein
MLQDIGSFRAQLRYVYNSYRTALLNRKYYGERLTTYQRYNYAMELSIAIGATSSGGVAGLAVWGSITGQYAWLIISGIATILSVAKPALHLSRNIERYTRLYTGHGNIYLELKSIVEDIEISRSLSPSMAKRYNSIKRSIAELGGLDDPRQDKNLIGYMPSVSIFNECPLELLP